MMIVSQFRQVNLSVANVRTYVFAVFFVSGNIIFPQLCHLIPEGGKDFVADLFLYFDCSLQIWIESWLLTAILSPLCNHVLFGMPPLAVLPVLLVKSSVLAVVAAWVAGKTEQLSLLHIALVVLAYQVIGGLAEWGITTEWSAALQDFRLGYPGMLLQVIAGWGLLKCLAKYS